MSQLLTLQVPADAPFHALAVEAAERIGTMAGVGSAQAGAFGQEVREALTGITAGTGGTPAEAGVPESVLAEPQAIVLAFQTDPGSVRVTITCGGRALEARCGRSGAPH
jgi:hypothetical protein